MTTFKARIGEIGMLVIPAKYRSGLALKPGDDVALVLEEGGIRVLSTRLAVAQAQPGCGVMSGKAGAYPKS